jgi:hypothetical protein
MRFKLIGCEVLYRELADAVARSPHTTDVEFLPKALHDRGSSAMRAALQERIGAVDAAAYSAVLLGYGLCGNGLAGLAARSLPLVAPRAHDCIGLLLGGRARHREYFDAHPGTYYRSTGWLERGPAGEQLTPEIDELIRRHGEENGRYLFDELHRYEKAYTRLAFIETGLEPDGRFGELARREAQERGWTFEKLAGSLALFRALAAGDWDPADFLVVEPGCRIAARYDDAIFTAEANA